MSKHRKLSDIILRVIVPLLHTLLWGAGIVLGFLIVEETWPYVNEINRGEIFWAISAIYVIFLLEMVLNMLESAFIHRKWIVNIRFMVLVAFMFFLFAATFAFSTVFMLNNSNDNCALRSLYGIATIAVLLKLSDMFFSRNEDCFMSERGMIQINSSYV